MIEIITLLILYGLSLQVPTCTASFPGIDERVNYAYIISEGDMEFIGTISAESKFDPFAEGDSCWKEKTLELDESGEAIKIQKCGEAQSFGYCQIHKRHNPERQKEYRALVTDEERMDLCFKIYTEYESRGVLDNRLYGHRVWQWGLNNLGIECDI